MVDKQQIQAILEKFVKNNETIESAMIISPDGFPIHTIVKDDEDTERIAAMGASFVSLAKRVAMDVKGSDLKKVVVETDNGRIVCVPLAKGMSLFLVVR
ncbi:conserved hypothetical protein [Thermosulfidibacter takaii ABI70S6]|uniref:Roadblock/LAMTOR2 domain-containing protein n=1 Tax=Thermosulfidibacter takaii (strain DSM 17441 / JCM 13301 / NBRC 103674 / ABI70S6) TaxID=1298851 RepID=A0A0S3QVG4_THET7|nr:roadblock/LC7 domain-containing protein [Thermosulfidibacter takaii]BAT72333.1 conserved hypothetical protein [Thermosulfidibacter takaii ABI70S6]